MKDSELRGLIRAFIDEARAIRQEIHAAQQAANAQTKRQPVEPLCVEVKTDPRLPVANREHYEAENRNSKSIWRKVWTGLEVIGIGSAFVLAILTLRTLHEIQKQTPEITKAANASDKQAKLLAQQMKITLGAVVTFEFALVEEGVYVHVINFGHSISRGAKGKLTITRIVLPSQKKMESASYEIVVPDLLPIEQPHLNEWGRLYTVAGFTPYKWEAIRRMEESVTVSGTFSYSDGFGETISKSICSSYLWYRVLNSAGGAIGTQDFVPCEQFATRLKAATQAKQEEREGKKP